MSSTEIAKYHYWPDCMIPGCAECLWWDICWALADCNARNDLYPPNSCIGCVVEYYDMPGVSQWIPDATCPKHGDPEVLKQIYAGIPGW